MTRVNRPGDQIGGYELTEYLASGGNGHVWRARCGNDEVALKVLKETSTERLQRFRDEIEVHRRIGRRDGVLPVLDSAVPDRPTRKDPAWLAMPIATPVEVALGENPSLRSVVDMVHSVSETMAKLHCEGVYHRDIKPGNLLLLGRSWVIGDFGLVSFPDKVDVTVSGRRLGPMNFHAPEMLLGPDSALGGPADVFSLAKTLWAIATGFRFPLPGHLSASDPEATLSKWVSGLDSRPLDLLVDRATRLGPSARCSMEDFAGELREWLEPPRKSSDHADLSYLAPRLLALAEPHVRERDAIDLAAADTRRIQRAAGKALERLHEALSTTGLATRTGDGWNWWSDFVERRDLPWIADARCMGMTNIITGIPPAYMASGITHRVTNDGRVELSGGHGILARNGESHLVISRVEPRVVARGSMMEAAALREIADELVSSTGAAAERLIEIMRLG
jgi:hypothetical protein